MCKAAELRVGTWLGLICQQNLPACLSTYRKGNWKHCLYYNPEIRRRQISLCHSAFTIARLNSPVLKMSLYVCVYLFMGLLDGAKEEYIRGALVCIWRVHKVAKMNTFYFDKSRDLEVNLFYCKLNERWTKKSVDCWSIKISRKKIKIMKSCWKWTVTYFKNIHLNNYALDFGYKMKVSYILKLLTVG